MRFFKGDLRKLVAEIYTDTVIEKFYSIDETVDWRCYRKQIIQFIQYGRKALHVELTSKSTVFSPAISNWLKYFHKAYRSGKVDECALWDRVCVTTLFTFYFKKSVETIEYCKRLVRDQQDVVVGGVMASLIPDEIEEATGIQPFVGLLDKKGVLDRWDRKIIDQLTPDYSILEEIDYHYPEHDGYYGYTSRGCIRKCDFCAVPTLEPEFKEYVDISEQIDDVSQLYGARRNLLLLDNNVLASKKFDAIIDDIRANGFAKGSKYVSPNYLELAIKNLQTGINVYGYTRLAYRLLLEFEARLAGVTLKNYQEILAKYEICSEYLPLTEQIIGAYEEIAELYEQRRNKAAKFRYVDFNQGVDARLLTDEKMALLATIPIKPLRIAFDSMKYASAYEKAVRLAAKHGIRNLSNYLLYNFEDEPIELYRRMRINVELSNELNLQIYSFPMRYSPIWDDNKLHHGRTYIGRLWNKKYIRSIQTVLNATKGKVGTKLDFFKAAFGKDEDEFYEILYMPEAYILHRRFCENKGLTAAWRTLYSLLNAEEIKEVLPVIESNIFEQDDLQRSNERVKCFLRHYQVSYKTLDTAEEELEKLVAETYKVVDCKECLVN
ncbi:hypothetical protein [Desulfogranum marinum]|uniref:hypothetical protein n=1 Tax=Desulfogranum marinum TaxID=453220 RepID=UPI00196558E7|nr:hypothetical protein [Desulfogranum marinum]